MRRSRTRARLTFRLSRHFRNLNSTGSNGQFIPPCGLRRRQVHISRRSGMPACGPFLRWGGSSHCSGEPCEAHLIALSLASDAARADPFSPGVCRESSQCCALAAGVLTPLRSLAPQRAQYSTGACGDRVARTSDTWTPGIHATSGCRSLESGFVGEALNACGAHAPQTIGWRSCAHLLLGQAFCYCLRQWRNGAGMACDHRPCRGWHDIGGAPLVHSAAQPRCLSGRRNRLGRTG